ncbi:glycosyltransferase [Aequorivita sp. SDUM287046]|uniref:Glycosyltransferase n=1 Tax=Aequorivita aurantiaca TaxID=3053356 RepID=A0ABT8DI71_9FLAO|nr:glycosyltransferase [Aequorivita aurantiaca]MDN3722795.1 glycosyltransferase [Aequorivita aurantiaca]
MTKKKTILVAPLHWGLGHATRCIPIISALRESGFEVILASDGAALLLLQKEFPQLEYVELPSYNITYSKNKHLFKWKLFTNLFTIFNTILSEKRIVQKLVAEGKIQGIISDNRFGVRSKRVPSVFITHQLNVLSGSTTYLSSKINQWFIKKFDVCWVPDTENVVLNLSGKLGHLTHESFPIKYIGILNRMKKREIPKSIDILALISGPEPQRSLFEEMLKQTLCKSRQRVLMVQGIVEKEQKTHYFENIEIVNFLTTESLEEALNKSETVISRSGYTTIMDLASLEKKVFFIPTPGQYEQEYLAKRLKNLGIVPSCKQQKFKLKKLKRISVFSGLENIAVEPVNFPELFSLFQGK